MNLKPNENNFNFELEINLLIYANDLDNLALFKKFFESNFPVLIIFASNNMVDVIEKTNQKNIDILLINSDMEDSNAIELIQEIRNINKYVIIIFSSDMRKVSDLINVFNSGVNYFVEKQQDTTLYINEIDNILRKALVNVRNRQILREKEENYKIIFENSPISLFELDFSKIKSKMLSLGINEDYSDEKILEIIQKNRTFLLRKISINRINNQTMKLFKIQSVEFLYENFTKIFTPTTYKNFETAIFRLFRGDSLVNFISVEKDMDGLEVIGDLYFNVPIGYEKSLSKVLLTYVDITERTRQNETINQLYQTIQRSSSVIILTDLNGNIEYTNNRFTEISGYSFNEVYGKNPRIWKSSYHDDIIYKNLWDTIKSGKEWVGEFLNKKKNGDLYWENAKIIPVRNLNSEIVKFLAIKEDITGKKIAEQQLHQSEERLSLAIESNDLAYFEIAFDLSEINFNEKFYDLFELKPGDINEKDDLFQFIEVKVHPDDSLLVKESLQQIFDKKTNAVTLEFRIIHKSKKVLWISLNAKILLKKSIFERDWIIGIANDITERKNNLLNIMNSRENLENEVKNRTKDLEIEKAKIVTIIETIDEPIIVFDVGYNISFINNAFLNLEEKLKRRKIELDQGQFEFIPLIIRYLKNKIKDDENFEPIKDLYFQLKSKNITDSSKTEKLGTVVELIDVTSFVEFDKLQKEFFSTVSHELRTPITAIKLSLQNLEKYGQRIDIQKQETIWKILTANTQVLADMIEDLLLLSRVQEKKLELKIEECFLDEILIKEVLPQLDINRSIKNITIISKIDKNLKLNADKKRISQILRIFIDNAIKYSENNKKITLESITNYYGSYNVQNKEGCLIKIIDEGIGIKNDELDNIFKRFYRASEVRDKIRGSGLGLGIAKELIELHGGNIFIESKYNVGTTIIIFLPYIKNDYLKQKKKFK